MYAKLYITEACVQIVVNSVHVFYAPICLYRLGVDDVFKQVKDMEGKVQEALKSSAEQLQAGEEALRTKELDEMVAWQQMQNKRQLVRPSPKDSCLVRLVSSMLVQCGLTLLFVHRVMLYKAGH